MTAVLTVADVQVDAGQKETQVLHVPVTGRAVEVPVIVINGRRDGPRVTVTAGIHPAEYVGIEAARRLGLALDPADMTGSVVIVPICNTTAFFARSISTCELDTENLNRVFPGDPDGPPSAALAHWLFETIIRPSQYYIDLHGGDMIEALLPFVMYLRTEDEVETASQAMARATCLPRVVSGVVAGSTYGAAAQAGIPAILSEIGGQGVWTDEQVTQHVDGVLGVLRHLHVLPGGEPSRNGQVLFSTFLSVRAGARGLLHPEVAVGDQVEVGQCVGKITDYFGHELQRLEAPSAGEVIFQVTSLAMNSGDPILGIVSQ